MRSVLLATTGLYEEGGIPSVNRCIARALDGAVEAGRLDRVHRLSLADRADVPRPPYGEWRTAGGRQPLFVWHAWRMLRRLDPDLVLIDHIGVARAFHLPLPGLRPRRTAIFVHGRELDGVTSPRRRAVILDADRLVTNSLHTAGVVRERYPEVADRIRPAVLCIDPERIALWESLPQEELKREPAVLFVGRLAAGMPGKGLDTLLEAWPRVRAAAPEAELWIAGGGDDRARLEALAARRGVAAAVKFLGRISDEELSQRYRRAAAFAMPSRQEGFGLVYAEAMWHGCPAIGSTSDAAHEVIRDGETGLLIPYGDATATAEAVLDLLRDPERRDALSEAGRRDVRERFGYERFRRDLLDALDLD